MNHAVALAELVTYIEEARTDALVAPVFVLAYLTALYTTRMEQLGTIMTGRVHSTKLKNQILRYFPDLEEHKQGRDVLLAFNQDLGSALQKACGQDADDDAIHLARAANIVRRDMLKIKTAFSGSFDTYCQEDSVPHTLTGLVGMVLNGSNIRDQQYERYVEERLVNRTKPIADPIKRNNLSLFSRPPVRKKSKAQLHLSSTKNDCSLFSRLCIASHVRDGDIDAFFEHENQACPPALSQVGNIILGKKSDLVGCLEDLIPPRENASSPAVEVVILDGAAIVNMLAPGTTKTFSEYATQVFLPYVTSQLQHASRVDVVFDEYLPDSLKAATRKKRGKGIRRRVEPSSSIPRNWQAFLRIHETELFSFLAMKIAAKETEKQIVSTHRTDVFCTQPRDVAGLAPCTHEEADTRMLLHVEDAVKQGYTKVSVRTVDTEVVVLAVTAAQRLNIDELWVAFATGRSFRFLAAHEIAKTLGPNKCRALLFFHAFTGCDTVSCFGGRGKKTA